MTPASTNRVVFVTGVSGSGKSTIGERLADLWKAKFADADDFHSTVNRQKMAAGIPLDDADRAPWLAEINSFAKKQLAESNLVVACSALKQNYRDQLAGSIESQCEWVLLNGSFALIESRMKSRNHFMPVELLQTQFDILEKLDNGIEVDIDQPIEAILQRLVQCLGLRPNTSFAPKVIA